MGARTLQAKSLPGETAVLTTAVTRAAGLLGLTQRQVAETLGLSGPTASRLFTGKYRLSPTRAKEWELAILFVRLFRSLDALWGHERALHVPGSKSYNTALGAAPLDLIKSATGLVRPASRSARRSSWRRGRPRCGVRSAK